jgi:hypothetical protein
VLPLRARLLWIGLWTHCDDEGRTKDDVKLIKARIWPLDQVTLRDIEEDLVTLAVCGRIVRYQAGGKAYLAITNWRDHQSINKPTPSKIPPPPLNGSRRTTGTIPEDSGGERKGKEGKGRDAREVPESSGMPNYGPEPPTKCPKHLDLQKPPACGECADARKDHAKWQAARNRWERDAPKCPRHDGELAHNCRPCQSELKGGVDA